MWFGLQGPTEFDTLLQTVRQCPGWGFSDMIDFEEIDDVLDDGPMADFFSLCQTPEES